MLKAFRYRLYPTKQQQVLLAKHFGCYRFVYNWGLERKTKAYKEDKKSLSCISLMNELPQLKQEHEWLREVNSQALQMSLRNLDNAFTNFFEKRADFPKFKKKRGRQSFQCPQKVRVDFDNGLLHLLKIPSIKTVYHRRFDGKVKTTTISRSASGKYFVSILVETAEEPQAKPAVSGATAVGIDLGLKDFATLSTGEKVAHPKFLRKSLRRLKAVQHRFGKKRKGSKRKEKARRRLAKLHEHVRNQRDDFLHKLTHRLCHDNQVGTYVLETLGVECMVKNHRLAQAIEDSGWSRFLLMLRYKADWYGKNVLQIGRFEPSSKTCSVCGYINKSLTLKDREWTCPHCGTVHDRDVNAAVNIRDFGLRHHGFCVGLDESEVTLRESATLVATLN
jgi:putative transposase